MHITKASIVDFLPRFENNHYKIGVIETMGALYPKTHNYLDCSKVNSILCFIQGCSSISISERKKFGTMWGLGRMVAQEWISNFHVGVNMVLTNVDTTCGKILPENNYFVSNPRAPYHVYISGGCLHVPSINE